MDECIDCGAIIDGGKRCYECRDEYRNGLADARYEESRDR